MLSGDGNENGQNKISYKANWEKKHLCRVRHNFFFCTFLCRCFARLQRETSRNFIVTRFMEQMSYVFLFRFFSLPLMIIFTLVTASISHFLTAAIKFSCFSYFQRDWSPVFFISRSSFFSVIHINVDIEN